nr:hypothetical protein [Tanacetum cinerariifolium]
MCSTITTKEMRINSTSQNLPSNITSLAPQVMLSETSGWGNTCKFIHDSRANSNASNNTSSNNSPGGNNTSGHNNASSYTTNGIPELAGNRDGGGESLIIKSGYRGGD